VTKYKYEIVDRDDTDEGQVIYEDAAYKALCPKPVTYKKPVKDLAVGESTLQVYNRRGKRSVYRVTRVE
jgi:hypothetical protein